MARCCHEPKEPGFKVCAGCLAQRRDAAEKARLVNLAPRRDDGAKECTKCHQWWSLDAFFRSKARKTDGRKSQCKACDKLDAERWRRNNGYLPMRMRPPITDGRAYCPRCDDWLTVDSFGKCQRGRLGISSWCLACTAEGNRERRIAPRCKCGEPREPQQDQCAKCLSMDGTGQDGAVISALRVLGGEAQVAAIAEDLGYDINEDSNKGSGHRYVRRGLAKLRSRGQVVSEYVKNDDKRRGEVGVHKLRRGGVK